MPTDDERRAVAARLRGIKTTREGCGHELCCDLWEAVFDSDYRCDECEIASLDRLADLIDPDCGTQEADISPVPEHNADLSKMVDRDALLALADEMEGIYRAPDAARWYARRIREACGEEAYHAEA